MGNQNAEVTQLILQSKQAFNEKTGPTEIYTGRPAKRE